MRLSRVMSVLLVAIFLVSSSQHTFLYLSLVERPGKSVK